MIEKRNIQFYSKGFAIAETWNSHETKLASSPLYFLGFFALVIAYRSAEIYSKTLCTHPNHLSISTLCSDSSKSFQSYVTPWEPV